MKIKLPCLAVYYDYDNTSYFSNINLSMIDFFNKITVIIGNISFKNQHKLQRIRILPATLLEKYTQIEKNESHSDSLFINEISDDMIESLIYELHLKGSSNIVLFNNTKIIQDRFNFIGRNNNSDDTFRYNTNPHILLNYAVYLEKIGHWIFSLMIYKSLQMSSGKFEREAAQRINHKVFDFNKKSRDIMNLIYNHEQARLKEHPTEIFEILLPSLIGHNTYQAFKIYNDLISMHVVPEELFKNYYEFLKKKSEEKELFTNINSINNFLMEVTSHENNSGN